MPQLLLRSAALLWLFLLQSQGRNGKISLKDSGKQVIKHDIADAVHHESGGDEMKQVIACSPNPMNITCPREHNIEIINGNYGRFTITLCNNQVKTITCFF